MHHDLDYWQEQVGRDESDYAVELSAMERRERLYRGCRDINEVVKGDASHRTTPHVRNIVAEAIEGQISSDIPMPKVTPMRAEDEDLAQIIENMLKNLMDKLPMERLNDIMERTVPIQGGAGYLIDWDHSKGGHLQSGEIVVSDVHPLKIIPQSGMYGDVEDMDYITLRLPQTKSYIYKRYGKTVEDVSEDKPEIRGLDSSTAEDIVTQYVIYYRNDNGGIGIYSYVNDTVLEDIEDYQARHLRRCTSCGEAEPQEGDTVGGVEFTKGDPCPYCGGEFADGEEGYEEIYTGFVTRHGLYVPGAEEVGLSLPEGEETVPVSEPTKIPFYKPDKYPIILHKNVSLYGSFLGSSDVDSIADQQNTTNRLEMNIIEKLLAGGSYMAIPNDAKIETGAANMKMIRLKNIEDKQRLGIYDMQGSIEQDITQLEQVYQESRQIIGLTDSYQGRTDKTATSGKAKEFSASQAAGRLESKRRMKDAAWAEMYELVFKFMLAYADEKRPVYFNDVKGKKQWDEFNRYDFLEIDEAGEYYWNDRFLFSVDTSATLSQNREAMWQETRSNFESGCFGNPSDIKTIVHYWTRMDLLHYPGAKETRDYAEQLLREQSMAALKADNEVNARLQQDQQAEAAQAQQLQQQQQEAALMQQVAAQAASDAKTDSDKKKNREDLEQQYYEEPPIEEAEPEETGKKGKEQEGEDES